MFGGCEQLDPHNSYSAIEEIQDAASVIIQVAFAIRTPYIGHVMGFDY